MKHATEIAVIIDESGSMEKLAGDTIGSFNKFLKEQQDLPGEATLSLVLFNTEHRTVCLNAPIKDVKPLDEATYRPGGYTALLDAVGCTIDDLGRKLGDMADSDRPDKVVVVIITDGEENRSREYKLDQVKAKIAEQQSKCGWTFLFLGANQDSFAVAGKLGLSAGHTMNYAADANGVRRAYGVTNQTLTSIRGGGSSVLPST